MVSQEYIGEINYDVFCRERLKRTKYGVPCFIECHECEKKAYQNKLWNDEVLVIKRDKRSGASAGA